MYYYLVLISPAQIIFICMIVWALAAYSGRWCNASHVAFAIALILIGIGGALYFWIALFSPHLANWLRLTYLAATIYCANSAYRRGLFTRELLIPVGILAISSGVLTLAVILRSDPDDILRSVANIWRPMPVDNEIPFRFAMNLWDGKIDIPLLPEWHASDRPPLQSALFLLLQLGVKPNPIRYEICSIVLQMTALPALWCVLRTIQVQKWPAIAIVIITFLAPMTIMNGIFVWPKLIAAGYLCNATVVLLSKFSITRPYLAAALFGAAFALAQLCHGTSAFTAPAFAIIALIRIRSNIFRKGFVAGVACVALYLPWIGFQKFYDPPGNRLLKYHFAGATDYTEEPFLPLLKKAYSDKSIAKIYEIRKFGVTDVVFGLIPETYSALAVSMADFVRRTSPPAQLLTDLRDREFLRMIPSMGIIGILFPLVLAGFLSKRIRPLAIVVVATVAFWVATIFDPFTMTPHTGSYLVQFFTIATVGAILAALNAWLLVPLLLLQLWATSAVYAI